MKALYSLKHLVWRDGSCFIGGSGRSAVGEHLVSAKPPAVPPEAFFYPVRHLLCKCGTEENASTAIAHSSVAADLVIGFRQSTYLVRMQKGQRQILEGYDMPKSLRM